MNWKPLAWARRPVCPADLLCDTHPAVPGGGSAITSKAVFQVTRVSKEDGLLFSLACPNLRVSCFVPRPESPEKNEPKNGRVLFLKHTIPREQPQQLIAPAAGAVGALATNAHN